MQEASGVVGPPSPQGYKNQGAEAHKAAIRMAKMRLRFFSMVGSILVTANITLPAYAIAEGEGHFRTEQGEGLELGRS